jgi:hypothetical protein
MPQQRRGISSLAKLATATHEASNIWAPSYHRQPQVKLGPERVQFYNSLENDRSGRRCNCCSERELPSSSIMHPITRRPDLLLLITWLFYFSQNCHAFLGLEYATTNCVTYTAIGAAQWCCNGDCADGTIVDSLTGLCMNWLSPIYDPPTLPSCTSTQVWGLGPREVLTVGGICATGSECQWESEQYSYNCCECPAGYVSDTTNYEQYLTFFPFRVAMDVLTPERP